MYSSFIDKVSEIVKRYGVGILTDSRFFNIVSDTYSFSGDYRLKDALKICIQKKYIQLLTECSPTTKDIEAVIKKIIDFEKSFKQDNEPELTAVLFSMAIAIGACSRQDYQQFVNRNTQSAHPQLTSSPQGTQPQPSSSPQGTEPQPSSSSQGGKQQAGQAPRKPQTHTKPTSKHTHIQSPTQLSEQERIGILWYVVWASFVSLGLTMIYGAFYAGWKLFWIVLIVAFNQLMFTSYVNDSIRKGNPLYKERLLSYMAPFQLPIFLNSLFSLLFFIEKFRLSFGNYLFGSPESPAGPELGTFFICLTYIFFSFRWCYKIISNHNVGALNKQLLLRTSFFIAIAYSVLLTTPPILWSVHKEKVKHQERREDNYYQQQLEQNKALQIARDTIIDLAVKGIELGSAYEPARQKAKRDQNLKELAGSLSKNKEYRIVIDGVKDPLNTIENYELEPKYLNKDSVKNKIVVTGKWFAVDTSIDNMPVTVRTFEHQGKAAIIEIVFNSTDSHDSELNQKWVDLYTKKYGEPEKMTITGLPYREGDPNPNKLRVVTPPNGIPVMVGRPGNDDVWTFKNGSIRITDIAVIYMTKEFEKAMLNLNEQVITKVKKQKEAEDEAFRKELERKIEEAERKAQLKKEADRRDSIQQAKNHKNAINEI